MVSFSNLWAIQEPLLAMAGIIEVYLHFSGKIRKWRNATAEWWVNIQVLKQGDYFQINQRFLEIFHLIYGSKLLSWRRLIASFVSSMFFLLIAYYLLVVIFTRFLGFSDVWDTKNNVYLLWLNIERDSLNFLHPFTIYAVVFDSIGVNLIPDFVSLGETGWILKKASKSGSNLLKLFFIDLILTTAICAGAQLIAIFYHQLIILDVPLEFLSQGILEEVKWRFLPGSGCPPSWFAFVVTTFSTSILWFTFLFSVIIAAIIKRSSILLAKALESRIVNELPVVLIVGIPCLVSWPILFVLMILR